MNKVDKIRWCIFAMGLLVTVIGIFAAILFTLTPAVAVYPVVTGLIIMWVASDIARIQQIHSVISYFRRRNDDGSI